MKVENKSLDAKLEFDKQPNQQSNSEKEKSLVQIIGQVLPFAPMIYEQFTGQKVPAMSGTIADIQNTLNQVLTNQQDIFNRIVNLEANASSQLTSLDRRLENLQSWKLTHEKKQLEFNKEDYD